jgi:creatinine amidohydrolase
MTWPEVKQLSEGEPLAIIPVGQVVQHGPHLPIGTDIYQAEGVSAAVAQQLKSQGHNAFVGPTITFGYSPAHECFPGYITMRPEVLTDQIDDVASSLARQGLRKQAMIMFGPGSWPSLNVVASRLARLGTANMLVIDGLGTARNLSGDVLTGVDPASGKFDVHAGELETSLMLAVAPHLVRMDKAVTHYSELYASFSNCACTRGPLQQQIAAVGLRDWSDFGEDGVTGDATLATAEKGEKIVGRAVTEIVRHLEHCILAQPKT